MLIEKHTWCFACDKGELVRDEYDHSGVAVDRCNTCRAVKFTDLYGNGLFEHGYVVEYHPDGYPFQW